MVRQEVWREKRKVRFFGKRKCELTAQIVREVARGDKPYLRKSTDRKAQIRKAFVQFSGLICALQSLDFLR